MEKRNSTPIAPAKKLHGSIIKTDLETLQPWTTFGHDSHQAIQSAVTSRNLGYTSFTIETSQKTRIVDDEQRLRFHAAVTLQEPVKEVLKKLGADGKFVSRCGDHEIIGDPDFAWVMDPTKPHAKVIVQYKTWWVADLVDILAGFTGIRRDTLSQQSLEALQQIYARNYAQGYHMQPVNGEYELLTLDFCLCRFDLSSTRGGGGVCVVNARFLSPDLQVVCKVVDGICSGAVDLLDNEAWAYAALQDLQGKVIPTLYGFYEVWGILQLLALEPVGNPIAEDAKIVRTLRKKMKATLQCIHDAGFVLGDIARRNFCRTESGDVFLVDLERCRPSHDPSELDKEMDEVDVL